MILQLAEAMLVLNYGSFSQTSIASQEIEEMRDSFRKWVTQAVRSSVVGVIGNDEVQQLPNDIANRSG